MAPIIEPPRCAQCGDEIDVLELRDTVRGGGAPIWLANGFALFTVLAGTVGKVYCRVCAEVRRRHGDD